ncbi:MAG: YeeE/YedE family protein [Cytophagaceae bacterium]|nr:YeeE/YedE family protein [Cytophagaceae bacterium]
MLPIDVIALFGKIGGYLIFILIGLGFGVSLELAGFGDSRRLAAQFYFKDMTVLKTMFTAIVVACILIFLSSGLGFLDFAQISVNETFLWPGIIGGLIMGVGFVIGGYCPGTSLVATASLKLGGLFFLVGAVVGAGVFGETLPTYEDFWYSSFHGRYLLSDWLGWSVGATVFAVVLMAVAMFYAAEKTEEYFRNEGTNKPWSWKISRKAYWFGAGVLVVMSVIVWMIGQPDPARKWKMLESKYSGMLTSKKVFIHPLEYVKTSNDAGVKLITLDLRPAAQYNAFHLYGSVNAKMDDVLDTKFVTPYTQLPVNGVLILIAENDSIAVQAWKYLKVQGIENLYIMENGLQNWNSLFADKKVHEEHINLSSPPVEVLKLFKKDAFVPKLKIGTKKRSGGLCG